jgi:hypothetical protein
LEAEQAQAVKTGWINEAFGSWLMGAGGKKDFIPYLNILGLGEKKAELKPEQRAAMIEKANAIAEKILKMHSKKPVAKKVKGNGKKNRP